MKKPDRNRKPSRPHNLRRQPRSQRDPTHGRHDHSGEGYVRRVTAAAAFGGIVKPGQVTIGTVTHQPGCLRPYGGRCACQPDIECVDASGNVHVVGADGEVTSRTRLN